MESTDCSYFNFDLHCSAGVTSVTSSCTSNACILFFIFCSHIIVLPVQSYFLLFVFGEFL